MDIVSGIVGYFLIWWVALFCVLPWGNAPPETPLEGTTHSAPARPRLALKFLVTTLAAGAIWLIVFTLVEIQVIDFHDTASRMMSEDRK